MASVCTKVSNYQVWREQAIKKSKRALEETENQIGVGEPIQKSGKVKRARERYDPWQMELKADALWSIRPAGCSRGVPC
ncbi:hypothetical protein HispidOSU_001663 [Sigmodon hispidus]